MPSIAEILGLSVYGAALNCALTNQVKEYKVSSALRFSRRVARLSLTCFALTGSLNANADEQVLKIGVTTGPHEEIFQAVKKSGGTRLRSAYPHCGLQ